MSIRTRLLSLLALAILLPAILMGLRFVQERQAGIAAAERRIAALARSIAADLTDRIQGTAQLHYGLARAHDLHTRDRAVCSAFLSQVREQHPQYTGILTIDIDGQLFCDSLQTGRSLDLRDRRYFKEALAHPDRIALQPAFGRLTGSAVMQIAYAPQSEDVQFPFVLLASLDLKKFADGYVDSALAAGTELLIFDTDGTVLVWLPTTARIAPPGDSIAESPLFRFAAEARAGEVRDIAIGGEAKIWATAAPPDLPQDTVHVMVGLSKAALLAGADRQLTENFVVLAVVSLLLFGGGWLIADIAIRNPVQRLLAMSQRLGEGDLSARIPEPHPKGELGMLMGTLNGTATSLERQRADIERLDRSLRQAQKMEAVGQLTGGIAHDFNNLLTVVVGNLDLLESRLRADPESAELASMALRASLRGAELCRQLLAFGRRQTLQPEVLDMNRLVRSTTDLLRRTLGERVEIHTSLSSDLWPALADPSQVASALANLAINARDAMAEGGRVTIETANRTLGVPEAADAVPGDYVMLAVSDTGSGIPPDILEHVFEPFFTTKPEGKGSGLGLSMVYGFAKQSGGHVKIYSEVGYGTSVQLFLPRVRDDVAALPAPAAEPPAPAPAAPSATILLVEDNGEVRAVARRHLIALGYRVLEAENADAALPILASEERIDLLFTDVVMPGSMTGDVLAGEAEALRPGIKVLLTSGFAEAHLQHRAGADGGRFSLLGKPYRQRELAQRIAGLLRDGEAA